MSFVRLENLNDFIQPSTSCIKPVEKKTTGVVAKVADVSLSDCLACSGCITSAESVLVQQQNHEELFRIINDNKISKIKKQIVVSLSLQSITSLAHKYSLSVQETAERVASFFISLGCHKVYDINLARHLALVESYREFKERSKKQSSGDHKLKLPIISSICPGWICYVEKTNGDLVIPHLSRVRSPQQIMGALLKRINLADGAISRHDIYHLTLMPCFDKKLEASRQDFKDSSDGSQDVDCVLTPIELEEILASEEVGLLDFSPRKLDTLLDTDYDFDAPLTSHYGSASGGYAENIILTEAKLSIAPSIANNSCDNLKYSTFKNNDFIEINLDTKTGQQQQLQQQDKLPKMAIVNGFRNIQTVVQRLKRRALKYDYIEIMACPSGCINGGAQCKPNYGENQEKMLETNKRLYEDVPKVGLSLDSDDANSSIYKKLNLNSDNEIKQVLYTDFRSVPKMQNLTVAW